MWLVNFDDGTSLSESNCVWTDLPLDKRVMGLQLRLKPDIYVCLKRYHKYYFVREAMANPGEKTGTPVADIIGGHNLTLGVATEVRVEGGAVKIRTYALKNFLYSPAILRDGKTNGLPPSVETVPPDSVMTRG